MNRHGYIGRKMRLPKLQKNPAIIITAFGSSSRGKAAIEGIRKELDEKYSEYHIYWAYSSEIIRKKQGLSSLQQTLAQAESDGHRRAVVQPLHIFPGTEYQQILETCEFFPGMRVLTSETLMHRWDFVEEVLEVIEPEFLQGIDELNIVALHGTPLAADPVNIVYLGIENMLKKLYINVETACVEGVPGFHPLLATLQQYGVEQRFRRARIIPLMFVAGLHVEDDLMGDEDSWRAELEKMGIDVSCPMIEYHGEKYFKGLAFYDEITKYFSNRLDRALQLMEHY